MVATQPSHATATTSERKELDFRQVLRASRTETLTEQCCDISAVNGSAAPAIVNRVR